MYNHVTLNQEKVDSNIKFLVNQIDMLSVRLLVNDPIYRTMDDPRLSKADKQRELVDILDQLLIDKHFVGELFIVTRSGEMYNYNRSLNVSPPDSAYLNKLKNTNIPVWGGVKKDNKGNAYILLGRKYRNFYTGQQLGYLVVYINEQAIYRIMNKLVQDWGFSFIVNNDMYILSHPNKDKVGSVVFDTDLVNNFGDKGYKVSQFDGEPAIMTAHTLPSHFKNSGVEWKVISIISDKQLFKTIHRIDTYAKVIQIGIVLFTVILSVYASNKITGPLNRLNKKLKAFGKKNTKLKLLAPENKDELGVLENSFNDMVVRINDLIERNNEGKDQQRKLELIALQAQINPHFIYNTLDTIGWIAKMNKQDDIEKLVIALATFFRMSLHKGDKYITVREEIEIVKSYTFIEMMRFPNQFTIDYDISPEIMEHKIVKIIIQPLVENAIKHGIAKKRGLGHIQINGYPSGKYIRFEVIDDGAGFDVETVERNGFTKGYHGGGYGIRNVDERIKLEYGKDCGVQIDSRVGNGTTAVVTVKAVP